MVALAVELFVFFIHLFIYNGLYESANELSNELKLFEENLKTTCNYSLVPIPPLKIENIQYLL